MSIHVLKVLDQESLNQALKSGNATLIRRKGTISFYVFVCVVLISIILYRHSAKTLPDPPKCNHKDGALQCKTLKMHEILKFHENFYRSKCKTDQDKFLLKYIETKHKKRRRPKNERYNTPDCRSKYFVPGAQMRLIPVCLNTFLGILNVSRFRLNLLAKRYYESGQLPYETRGGFRKIDRYEPKKQSVMDFINRLKCVESHYCRSSTSSRMYLSSELNIKKLYRMYEGNPVTESYFRKIFNTEYNLGFGNPRTDVCSTCLELTEKIRTTKDQNVKQTLITQKRVHKLRANAFYALLRENKEDLLILSFDCQKNQPLPKVPDQATYYSRQVYIYNFTVVKGHSKGKLNPQTVTSYCWTENQFSKGSNEIASCIYDTLQTADLTQFTKIRLMSDGCGGQNKNSILVTMVCSWLIISAPRNIEEVEIIFPVTGHSYIPPDRVFGLSEKEIKRHEIILLPEEYQEIFSHYATVKNLGSDCQNFDWKDAKETIIKLPGTWHFKFNQCKRILLRRSSKNNDVLVQGEPYYKNCVGAPKGICRRGKSLRQLIPKVIEEKKSLKIEKKNDVNTLLSKHYGIDWRENEELELSFYKHVLDDAENIAETEETDIMCEPQEEVADLRI